MMGVRLAVGAEFTLICGFFNQSSEKRLDIDPNLVHHHTMIMRPNYKAPFSKFVKKAHKPLQLAIEDAVEEICGNPGIGDEKVGDLAGIWVYKFRFNCQEYLIAYRPPTPEAQGLAGAVEIVLIDFYQAGSHQNFYDELKRHLKSER